MKSPQVVARSVWLSGCTNVLISLPTAKIVSDGIKEGILVLSQSEYAFSIVSVPKSDGEFRLRDYRPLNKITKLPVYSSPRVH